MRKRKINTDHFQEQYFTAVQTLALLSDTQDLYCELGRGSGKTTHILAPRMDRVQHSMPGSVQVFLASSYKAIFENLVPGIMEYFLEHYERGMYFEIGTRPPRHFRPCKTLLTDWHNTISFVNGTVVQFVSAERPEQANGKNIAHLYMDEMLHIKQRVVDENVRPAMRSKATVFYDSPYFMGTTGTTSTPNIETDQDWFLRYQKQYAEPDNLQRVKTCQKLQIELDHRLYEQQKALIAANTDRANRLQRQAARIEAVLTKLRRGTVTYLHASSFSNIKVLGIDYIRKQIQGTVDTASLNTSIFAVRENRVKDMFFCKFGPMYITTDTYRTDRFVGRSLADTTGFTCLDLQHCDPSRELLLGYDPGPFSSLVVAQYSPDRQTLYVLKDFYCYWPQQQNELVEQFRLFFGPMRNKLLFLHYDRAANQHDPQWKKYKPYYGDTSDTDAFLLRDCLERAGFMPQLMSMGQPVITYKQHLHLLSRLFSGDKDYQVAGKRVVHVTVDENECEALISSIYNSPLKRHQGDIMLDKSSERLPYEQQAFQSTQIASAFMYLLWGEFGKRYLPGSSSHQLSADLTGFSAVR